MWWLTKIWRRKFTSFFRICSKLSIRIILVKFQSTNTRCRITRKSHSIYWRLPFFKLFFKCLGLTEKDAEISFQAIDKNGDGMLSIKEFVKLGRDFFLTENPKRVSRKFWGPLVPGHWVSLSLERGDRQKISYPNAFLKILASAPFNWHIESCVEKTRF